MFENLGEKKWNPEFNRKLTSTWYKNEPNNMANLDKECVKISIICDYSSWEKCDRNLLGQTQTETHARVKLSILKTVRSYSYRGTLLAAALHFLHFNSQIFPTENLVKNVLFTWQIFPVWQDSSLSLFPFQGIIEIFIQWMV